MKQTTPRTAAGTVAPTPCTRTSRSRCTDSHGRHALIGLPHAAAHTPGETALIAWFEADTRSSAIENSPQLAMRGWCGRGAS